MPTIKLVLGGTRLAVFPTDARAIVRYYLDFEGNAPSNPDPNVLINAVSQLPPIGSTGGFNPVSGNVDIHDDWLNVYDPNHYMRVDSFETGVDTGNSNKLFVDVTYQSRPRPTVEFGSSALQQKVNNYLAAAGVEFDPSNPVRKAMKLAYKRPADAVLNVDLDFPVNPVSGSRMAFSSSLRIASTYYYDELDSTTLNEIIGLYCPTINAKDFIFEGDARQWLCASINSVTNDGGYKIRLSGEFVFNPDGWDTVGVYINPSTGQLIIPSDADIATVYNTGLTANIEGVPEPSIPGAVGPEGWPLGGIGRFPQVPQFDLVPLATYLAQSSAKFNDIPSLNLT